MTLDNLLTELRRLEVKLWMEGDRLRYRAAKDALTPDLLSQMKTHKPAIIEFLRQATSASAQLPAIVPLDRDQPLPLSFAQQRFWFLHQFEPNTSSNNMPVVLRFTGTLDVLALERSLQAVVRRHEVLRTTFPEVKGQPTQVIRSDAAIALPIVDLQHLLPDQRDAEAYRLATEEARRPFDLLNGPILRLLLLRLSIQEHLLVWNMHCMICDGASSDVFYQDLTALYAAFSVGQPSPLKDLPIQYADFAYWQRQWLQGDVLDTQLSYWKRKLDGNLPLIQLPYDRPRPLTIQTGRGDRGAKMLPKSLNDALNALSQRLGTTLFMTLLAAFEVLLYRYSRQEDLLISFASAGRGQLETEQLLGFFSNTLILRTNLAGNPTFRELLGRVRDGSLEAYAHQDLPFEKLIDDLRPQPNQSLLPLFQVKFTLNPPWSKGRGMASVELPNLTMTSLFGYIYHGETKYDLMLVMREQDEGFGMVFDYNAELFDASTIARMLEHFQALLEGIVANPDQLISTLPLITPQKQPFLEGDSVAQTACIHEVFQAQVERTPDATAIVFKHQTLTYQQLNDRANQLAHYLQSLGLEVGDRVGIHSERSLDTIVGVLAILKAGGAYLPLTLDQPQLLSEVSLLLTRRPQFIAPDHLTIVYLDDWEPISQHSPEDLIESGSGDRVAYIANTSESDRGQGLGILHQRVVKTAAANFVHLSRDEVFLQVAPLTSGIAAFEIWSCLLNGAQLVIAPPHLSSQELGNLLQYYQVTTLWLAPRWLNRMVDEQIEAFNSVRQLLTGGDVLSVSHIQKFLQSFPNCKLISAYRPSEALPIAACYPITESTLPTPIGRPIAHTQMYLRDGNLQPLPIGVPGEIFIGGLVQSQSCADDSIKWVAHPDQPDAYLYPTGDLARYLPDGNLESLGTLATIHDFRIELSKVEAAIDSHPKVQEVSVLSQKDVAGTVHLVAYVVPDSTSELTTRELHSFLKQTLPTYMLPSSVVFLTMLPLTDTGTLDRAQLPKVNDRQFAQELQATFVTSRDDLELQLTKIWEDILGVRAIGIRDNFFELGGHSLLAVRLFAKIEETLDKKLSLSTLLKAPTIETQCEMIRAQGFAPPAQWLVPLQQGTADTSPLFCIYGILLYYNLARHIGPDQTVYGVYLQEEVDLLLDDQSTPLPLKNVPQIASLYLEKIRTIQPVGPYLLAGESFGGVVAYEMAQQLQAQGERVSLLALLDTQVPHSSLRLPWYKRWSLHAAELLNKGPNYLIHKLKPKLKFHPPHIPRDRRSQFRRQVGRGYVPQAYSGKVTLFRAMQRSQFEAIAIDPTFGWDTLALDGVETYDIPGDHLGILQEPNVQILAKDLKDCIDRGRVSDRNLCET
jgi:non-ribosomal peptide synthetase component F/thioesterase domain-containing protein/acyl carrier protein